MMCKEKIEILMEFYEAEDLDTLKARSIVNIETDEYDNIDNVQFLEMVRRAEYLDNLEIYNILKERGEL